MDAQVILSCDSRVFEPPDLWRERIGRRYREHAPRIERVATTTSWSSRANRPSPGDWLADFCRTDPDRLKGIAMINVDDGVRELERTAKLGFPGAMITEYPPEERRCDDPERLCAAAAALGMPLSLHAATRRQSTNAGPSAPCVTRAGAPPRCSSRHSRSAT